MACAEGWLHVEHGLLIRPLFQLLDLAGSRLDLGADGGDFVVQALSQKRNFFVLLCNFEILHEGREGIFIWNAFAVPLVQRCHSLGKKGFYGWVIDRAEQQIADGCHKAENDEYEQGNHQAKGLELGSAFSALELDLERNAI